MIITRKDIGVQHVPVNKDVCTQIQDKHHICEDIKNICHRRHSSVKNIGNSYTYTYIDDNPLSTQKKPKSNGDVCESDKYKETPGTNPVKLDDKLIVSWARAQNNNMIDLNHQSLYINHCNNSKAHCIVNNEKAQPAATNALNNLQQLENLLCKIFKGFQLSIEDFRLSVPELHILVEIFIRKNRNNCESR